MKTIGNEKENNNMTEGYEEIKLTETILLEKVPNKERRSYHIKTLISNQLILDIKYLDDPNMGVAKPLSDKARNLITSILSINGVDEVTVDKYEITVSKGRAFDWEADGVQDEIVKHLVEFQRYK